MNIDAQKIVDLKTEAKNLRDLGPDGYPEALATLNIAIGLASAALEQASQADAKVHDRARQMAKELADCHGMVGGVQRRWAIEGAVADRPARLAASCAAYDAGYRFEWDAHYDIRASYNLVNRLSGRLLMRPDLLQIDDTVDLGQGLDPLNLPQALAQAVTGIERHLANKGNFWAEADLALLRLLRGASDAEAAYAAFKSLSPPAYAYASALDGLRPLAATLGGALPALNSAVSVLDLRRRAAR